MSDFIDPEELPFTADEIFQAARRFLPEHVAQEIVDVYTETGAQMIEARAARRREWKAAGVPDATTRPLGGGWQLPDELLPALASLSPDVEARALQLMEEYWASRRQAELWTARRLAAEAAGLIPTPEQMLAEVKAKERKMSPKERRALRQGLVVSFPLLPEATAEMEAAADARVTDARREWGAKVAQFRR